MSTSPQVLKQWLFSTRAFAKQAQIGLDLLVLFLAFYLAYNLRFDFAIPSQEFRPMLLQGSYVTILQFASLAAMGTYLLIWRYVGMAEVHRFVAAASLSCVPLIAIRLGVPEEHRDLRVPLSVILMDTVLAFGGVLGLRVLRRTHYEWSRKKKKQSVSHSAPKSRVLLIGAGRAGVMAAGEIQSRGDSDLEIVGFIDDDPAKRGSIIQGVKVLGSTSHLPSVVQELGIDQLVISIAQASRSEFRRILDICERIPVKVRVIPGLHEILQGKVRVSRIRDLQIEDLLGRAPVQLDEGDMRRFVFGKTVLVTGAGGSIGSELARQLAMFEPDRLLLVERAEFALFEIDRELSRLDPGVVHISLIADVDDEPRMRAIFEEYRPQMVFHAAAHKHVPLMENNAAEAVKNNVLATHKIGRIAGEFGVEAFVLISTDKAVKPISVMGATKRVAELVVQDLNRWFTTRYVAVRFGNVIGSAGSVIPVFREQIRNGGPVTVTHPDMMRYFMTIPEAAHLVLEAGAMGNGGEIFILDMGEPVRILDLAKEAIIFSGLKPFEDIDIAFTGVRPGEKLFEELEIKEEEMSRTRHPKIFIGKIAAYPHQKVSHALEALSVMARNGRDQEIRAYLNHLLPEARVAVEDDSEPGVGLSNTWVSQVRSRRSAATP